jgi:hypothetical protein
MKVKSWVTIFGGAMGRVVVAEGVRSSGVSSFGRATCRAAGLGRYLGSRALSPVLPACLWRGRLLVGREPMT